MAVVLPKLSLIPRPTDKRVRQSSTASSLRMFVLAKVNTVELSATKPIVLSLEDEIANAEILQALHFVNNNYSFSSANPDSNKFELMFPDSTIAQNYRQSKTKSLCTVTFSLA